MTNGMIFKQAVTKALSNGWEHFGMSAIIEKGSPLAYTDADWENLVLKPQGYYPIIFSKDFAKAFFGDEQFDAYSEDNFEKWWTDKWEQKIIAKDAAELNYVGKTWELHLQNMVLEEEPIQYLAKFLD